MAFSADSRLSDLIADERARAILTQYFGDHTNDSRVQMVLYYTLREVASFPEAGISSQTLQAVDEELRKL